MSLCFSRFFAELSLYFTNTRAKEQEKHNSLICNHIQDTELRFARSLFSPLIYFIA